MKKIIISFLLLQLSLTTPDSTKVVIEPVSNTIVDAINTDRFFSLKATPDGTEPITVAAADLNNVLKLGDATLANCEADNTNWKCKPSSALSYGRYTLTVASSDSKIQSLTIEITDSKKEVQIVYAISATPKTTTVTGAIASNSDIEITLTANDAVKAAVAGDALSNYFKLGTVSLGTCSGTGLASSATAGTTATITCKNAQEIGVSATPYALGLESGKTAVSAMTIGVSGSVTVSASGNTGGNTGDNTGGNTGGNTGDNTGDNTSSGDNKTEEDKDSSFYLKNCLLILLAILF